VRVINTVAKCLELRYKAQAVRKAKSAIRNPKLDNRRGHKWGLACAGKRKPEPPLTNSWMMAVHENKWQNSIRTERPRPRAAACLGISDCGLRIA